MGGVKTDEWLEKEFNQPLEICERLRDSFGGDPSEKIYQYLSNFGMYHPNQRTHATFKELKEWKAWDRLEKIILKYKKKWKGSDVPVYLFPKKAGGLFLSTRQEIPKSGVSFEDKIFLFLSPLEDEKELEALFVHEYHHVCRMNKQKKRGKDYTLLDSIVLEGLAEHAVEEMVGEKYLAKWCKQYSSKEISQVWSRYMKDHLDSTKTTRIHDDLLFGSKKYPPLIGYAVGYELVSRYKQENSISIADSFIVTAEKIIKGIDL